MSLYLAPPLLFDLMTRRRRPVAAGAPLPIAITYDNFNGVNDASIAARVPPVPVSTNAWSIPTANAVIVTNNAKAEARFPTVGNAFARVDTGVANADIRVKTVVPSTGSNRSSGIVFRYTNASNFWYTQLNFSSQKAQIWEFTSATPTLRAEANFTVVADTEYTMRLVLQGDDMVFTVEGVGTVEFSSSVRNTATFHGIRATNSVGGGVVTFEDFIVLPPPTVADITINVAASPLFTSVYETSVSHVNTNDLVHGNATARSRAYTNLAGKLKYHRVSAHSYGANDPWLWDGTGTRPTNPWNWGNLDTYMAATVTMGGIPIVGFGNYPWHTKGRWLGGTSTTPLTYADQLSDDGRPITEKLTDVLHFVQKVVERYAVAANNPSGVAVRWWQPGGWEFHGFERGRDGTFTNWGFDDYAGTPGQADMGMAFLHNQIAARIISTCATLGIAREDIKIITNYPPMTANGVTGGGSVPADHPLRSKPWGTANKAPIDALLGMLPLLDEGSWDYWSYDQTSRNRDAIAATADDWVNNERFTDTAEYLRGAVDALGFSDMPFIVSERYSKPQVDPGLDQFQLRASLIADAEIRFIKAGASMAMTWSTIGRANEPGNEYEAGLHSLVNVSTGGVALPVLEVLDILGDYFGAGTPIHDMTITGTGVDGIASDTKVYLINKTNEDQTVNLDNTTYSLGPYERKLVDR